MWVNINFTRRYRSSAQKSHPSPNDFGKTFACSSIKPNETHFSLIFLTQNVLLCSWKTPIWISTAKYCKFLHIVSSLAYQTVAHQSKGCLSVTLLSTFASSLPRYAASPNSQSKVDNSRMCWYWNAVFTSNVY